MERIGNREEQKREVEEHISDLRGPHDDSRTVGGDQNGHDWRFCEEQSSIVVKSRSRSCNRWRVRGLGKGSERNGYRFHEYLNGWKLCVIGCSWQRDVNVNPVNTV